MQCANTIKSLVVLACVHYLHGLKLYTSSKSEFENLNLIPDTYLYLFESFLSLLFLAFIFLYFFFFFVETTIIGAKHMN